MSFSSKFAVVIAVSAILSPIAATANPVANGSTAAAVSIKFQSCCGTNGNFSISPGANASGGGIGVSELSAAVATGETDARAESSSSHHGTAATAAGWSAPVNFSFAVVTDREFSRDTADHSSHHKYDQSAAIQFGTHKKESESYFEDSSKVKISKLSGSKKHGINSESVKADQYSEQSGSSSAASVQLNSKTGSSATQNNTSKQTSEAGRSNTTTVYSYSGPSAGLRYLPDAK